MHGVCVDLFFFKEEKIILYP